MSFSKFQREIILHLNTGAHFVLVRVHGDEKRLLQELQELVYPDEETGYPGLEVAANKQGNSYCASLFSWNTATGVTAYGEAEAWQGAPQPGATMTQVIGTVATTVAPQGVYVFFDMANMLHEVTQNTLPLVRLVAELAKNSMINTTTDEFQATRMIVFVGYEDTLPAELRDYVRVVDFPLPGVRGMRNVVDRVCGRLAASDGTPADVSTELRDEIARSVLGLSATVAEDAIAMACGIHGEIDEALFPLIRNNKAKAFKQIPGLTVVQNEDIPSLDSLVGWDAFRAAANDCRASYTELARQLSIPRPRGCALVGVPGTGKTVGGKAMAKALGLDLVTMDLSAMFDSLLGNTEKHMRQALSAVNAMRGCVLLVDEIDKMLNNAHGSGTSDGGVSSRVLSLFLSWLSNQQQDSMIYVIMTMNRMAGLPPELTRAGRVDRVWCTSLPSPPQRKDIFDVHLAKHGDSIDWFKSTEISALQAATTNYSGAEIEEIVRQAVTRQFANNLADGKAVTSLEVSPTYDMLLQACGSVTPLAVIAADQLAEMEAWSSKHAVSVDTGHRPQTVTNGGSTLRGSKKK